MSGHISVLVRDKSYRRAGDAPLPVLRDIHFRVDSGELVVVTGASGCGKTTLLNILAGLDTRFNGKITADFVLDAGQRPVSYVFQEPRLLPWRTVRENILLAVGPYADDVQLQSLLQDVRLLDVCDRYPSALSIGMARRVSLARAFAARAPLLLMDEPFSSLDERLAKHFRKLLLTLLRGQHSPAVVFVTHNLREALFLADRLIILAGSPSGVQVDEKISDHDTDRTPAEIEKMQQRFLDTYPDLLA